MKLMIASDIHGSAPRCREMLERFEKEGADRLLLLGDLLYHGARNALPEGYDAWACADLLNAYAPVIMAVRGNCDSEETQTMLSFPCTAAYSYARTDSGIVFASHGDHYSPDHLPPRGSFRLLLFGHTHVPVFGEVAFSGGEGGSESLDGVRGEGSDGCDAWPGARTRGAQLKAYFANPGSVSIPKGGSVCGYMTLEEGGVLRWKTLAGKIYREEKI